jgi:DNA-binding MarR family transcriptional regulator
VLPLFLEARDTVSVTEAASALRVSHPAVIEMGRRMEVTGLLRISPDHADGPRRVLALSDEGRRLPESRSVWAVIAEELDEIIERTSGGDALSCLASIESQLDERELDTRVRDRLAGSDQPAPRVVIQSSDPGPGAHVANACYAVRADVRGMGLGRAMQPNTVVITNARAVRLWRSLCSRLIGMVPDGIRLRDGTTVPHHLMYRALP